jgi:hypothetical protein
MNTPPTYLLSQRTSQPQMGSLSPMQSVHSYSAIPRTPKQRIHNFSLPQFTWVDLCFSAWCCSVSLNLSPMHYGSHTSSQPPRQCTMIIVPDKAACTTRDHERHPKLFPRDRFILMIQFSASFLTITKPYRIGRRTWSVARKCVKGAESLSMYPRKSGTRISCSS